MRTAVPARCQSSFVNCLFFQSMRHSEKKCTESSFLFAEITPGGSFEVERQEMSIVRAPRRQVMLSFEVNRSLLSSGSALIER